MLTVVIKITPRDIGKHKKNKKDLTRKVFFAPGMLVNSCTGDYSPFLAVRICGIVRPDPLIIKAEM